MLVVRYRQEKATRQVVWLEEPGDLLMGGGDHVTGLIPETLQQSFLVGRPIAESPVAALLGETVAEAVGDEATSAVLTRDGYQVLVPRPAR